MAARKSAYLLFYERNRGQERPSDSNSEKETDGKDTADFPDLEIEKEDDSADDEEENTLPSDGNEAENE
jgi:hypothetical protein